jgi:hypothetical protein
MAYCTPSGQQARYREVESKTWCRGSARSDQAITCTPRMIQDCHALAQYVRTVRTGQGLAGELPKPKPEGGLLRPRGRDMAKQPHGAEMDGSLRGAEDAVPACSSALLRGTRAAPSRPAPLMALHQSGMARGRRSLPFSSSSHLSSPPFLFPSVLVCSCFLLARLCSCDQSFILPVTILL